MVLTVYYTCMLLPLRDFYDDDYSFKDFLNGLFANIPKPDQELYPGLKDSIFYSLKNISTRNENKDRLQTQNIEELL